MMQESANTGGGETACAALLKTRFEAALERRRPWESHWQECYDMTLPQQSAGGLRAAPGQRRHDEIFDGTAADAVDQLAASLLANLTPPWSRWFGFVPGPELDRPEAERLAPVLSRVSDRVQAHLDRSNFAVEMHQCYLDLVTAGTACLGLEAERPGELTALRFTAVPLADVVLEEGVGGRLDEVYRRLELTAAQFAARFPDQPLPDSLRDDRTGRLTVRVIEAVIPDGPVYRHEVMLDDGMAPRLLVARRLAENPFIAFRWLKAAGETYGRSPVMKALPDIKTANKVVELILKNASIAVTGLWQAEDDGVLNPATIELVPGAIIPKAVGSGGLTPLDMPGRFDVSQLVLDDLRNRIRHAMLIDRLAALDGRRMTATEVVERAAEMARILGATYGRLQSELLTPLVLKAFDILRQRGEVPDLPVDGRLVTLEHRSPLAQAQAQREVQATLTWLEATGGLGPEAGAVVDRAAAARWLGQRLGVAPELIRQAPAFAPPGAVPPVPAPPLAAVSPPPFPSTPTDQEMTR